MGILLVISVLALFALLWAAFSMARHVRRTRRKQRKASEVLERAEIERDAKASSDFETSLDEEQEQTPQARPQANSAPSQPSPEPIHRPQV